MHSNKYLFLLSISAVARAASSCDTGFTICSPAGATSATTPQIGSTEFQSLYVDIIQSSLPSSKRALPHFARGSTSLCCNEQLSCLAMSGLAIPFCYDKFTTNYYLPDGSTGTVVGGSYKSANSDTANLETGDYTLANGTTGNIYSANAAAKPSTATLPIPSQYTATGVGSAIPITALGSKIIVTYTTTLPGTTIQASTIPASTIAGAISTETILLPVTTTVAGATGSSVIVGASTSYSVVNVEASTVPASTVSGSTVAGVETTITTTSYSATSSTTASSTKKSGAGRVTIGGGLWVLGALCLWLV